MGIYIYTLRKDTKQAVLNGELVTVARADFGFKETLGLKPYQSTKIAAAGRAREALGEVNLVAFGDWEDGAVVKSVREDWTHGADTPGFPGKTIGFLRREKIGRRVVWAIEPKE